MAEQAKIEITIDPSQAREELDRIEAAAPGRQDRTRRVAGLGASATSALPRAPRAGIGAVEATGAGALLSGGRRFATIVKGAVQAVIAEKAVSVGFPVLAQVVADAVEELAGKDSEEKAAKLAEAVAKGLRDAEEGRQELWSRAKGIGAAVAETASVAYASALTGNYLSLGQLGDLMRAEFNANKVEFQNRSAQKQAVLERWTRNQADQIKDWLARHIQQSFLLASGGLAR